MTLVKECISCTFKHSCGYSSLNIGEENSQCVLGDKSDGISFFKKSTGLFWDFVNQKLVSEDKARKHNPNLNRNWWKE